MIYNVDIDDLFDKQFEIAEEIINTPASKTKYHILRASRQSGKTYLIEDLAIYFSLLKPSKIIAFVNAQHKQNRKVYNEMLERIPKEIITKTSNNDGDRYIIFVNNSVIQFYTAKNYDSIVGSSFDYFLGDEFAIWPLQAWDFIQPTVAAKKNAKVILASTPRGKNSFYNLCVRGQSTTDHFVKEHRMFYGDNPYYDLREVEEAKKSRPDAVWRQEYLAEFVMGQSAVFGDFSKSQTITEWESPKEGRRYFFGIDVAGQGRDSTVMFIISDEGKVVFCYEPQSEKLQTQAQELRTHIERYDAEGFVECNGIGVGLFEHLESFNLKVNQFWMSNESKDNMVTTFIKDLNNSFIYLPTVELCSKLDNEMTTYEVSRLPSGKLHYEHSKGLHDDYVDSLMIANWAKNEKLFNKSNVWSPEQAKVNPYPTTIDMRLNDDIYG